MVVDLLKKDVYNFYCISSRIEKTGQFYSSFKIGPFSQHQSLTLANSLRRALLADQSRCVFNALQIYGVEHEFSSLFGVRESVLDILLNLEKLVFQTQKPITKPKVAFVHFSGPGILRGKDIRLPSGVKCTDPSQYIATLEVDGQLTFKLFFSSEKLKRMYSPAIGGRALGLAQSDGRRPRAVASLGLRPSPTAGAKPGPPSAGLASVGRPVPSNFLFLKSSPLGAVIKANYTLQPAECSGSTRLGGARSAPPGDLEFILFEIWTDGSLHPKTAMSKAIDKLLLDIFFGLVQQDIPMKVQRKEITSLSKKKFREQFLNLEIGNFSFDLETFLFLKKNKIYRIIDLLDFTKKSDGCQQLWARSARLALFRTFLFSYIA